MLTLFRRFFFALRNFHPEDVEASEAAPFDIMDITGDDKLLERAMKIRHQVFTKEQGIAQEIDVDGRDGQARHFVAHVHGTPVATARLRMLDAQCGRIERVAVDKGFRKQGISTALIHYILDYLRMKGVPLVVVHAQHHLKPYYERLGFAPTGRVFYEANILHYELDYQLQPGQQQLSRAA